MVSIMLIDPNYTRAIWALVVVLVGLGLIEIVKAYLEWKRYHQTFLRRFSAKEKHTDWLANHTTVKTPAVKVPGVPLDQLSVRTRAVKVRTLRLLQQLMGP